MKIKLNEESRQKTPWDDVFNTTPTQEFIMKKYNENYKNKHPNLNDTNEAELINSVEVIIILFDIIVTNVKRLLLQ